MKKFIIENHEYSQTFAILLINSNDIGRLRYYLSNADGTNLWEAEEYGDYMDGLVEKARIICEENNARLMSY
ncbi:hypothetical protein [Flavobacterium sp.]|uniref:hypothetical protein n=1 Tax=Flavobacterium sp. TaxID=239 RepID=UPI00260F610C|nr:hypothetical protein [Flavobacterium sp.]